MGLDESLDVAPNLANHLFEFIHFKRIISRKRLSERMFQQNLFERKKLLIYIISNKYFFMK